MILQLSNMPDGTVQNDRLLTELLPEYVAVEERSTEEILAFIQKFAGELNYFDKQTAEITGDWSSFFTAGFTDEADKKDFRKDLVEFSSNPTAFLQNSSRPDRYTHPHLALLLAFLELVKYPQQQFRELTKRHLDFYYRDVLQLTEQPEQPDQLHAIFTLAEGEESHLIPAGTLINAGSDAGGKDLNYAVDKDLVVNTAQISSIKTLGVKKTTINLESFHRDKGRDTQKGFDRLMRWALGDPNPADSLPAFPDNITSLTDLMDNRGVSGDIYITNRLFMELADFDRMMSNVEVLLISGRNDEEKIYSKKNLYGLLKAVNLDLHKFLFQGDRTEPSVTLTGEPSVDVAAWLTDLSADEEQDTLELADYSQDEAIGYLRHILTEDLFSENIDISSEIDQKIARTFEIEMILDRLFNDLNAADESINALAETLVETAKQPSEFAKLTDNNSGSFLLEMINGDHFTSVKTSKWREVYPILEQASLDKQANTGVDREAVQNIVAETVYDETNGISVAEGGFKLFGNIPLGDETDLLTSYTPGFLMSSPVLLLREGKRIVRVNLSFKEAGFNQDQINDLIAGNESLFMVQASTAQAWIYPDTTLVECGDFFLDTLAKPLATYSDLSLQFNEPTNSGVLTSTTVQFTADDVGYAILLDEGDEVLAFAITSFTDEHNVNVEKIMEVNQSQLTHPPSQATKYARHVFANNTIRLTLTFNNGSTPALEAAQFVDPDIVVATAYPSLKIKLNPFINTVDTGYVSDYHYLKDLQLTLAVTQVEVEKVQELLLRNDESILDSKSPFLPFSSFPAAKSGFYLANSEISHKKLDQLTVNIEWTELPDSFANHYKAYSESSLVNRTINNKTFKAELHIFDDQNWQATNTSFNLFQNDGTLVDSLNAWAQPEYTNSDVDESSEGGTDESSKSGTDESSKSGTDESSKSSVHESVVRRLSVDAEGAIIGPLDAEDEPILISEIDNKILGGITDTDGKALEIYDDSEALVSIAENGKANWLIDTESGSELKIKNSRGEFIVIKDTTGQSLKVIKTGEDARADKVTYKVSPYQMLNYADFTLPEIEPLNIDSLDLFDWDRYFKFELKAPALLHDQAIEVSNETNLASAKKNAEGAINDDSGTEGFVFELPKTVFPAYTPTMQTVSVDYHASVVLDFTNDAIISESKTKPDQIILLHPFGNVNLLDTRAEDEAITGDNYYLLPRYENTGSCFIGIRDLALQTPQNITFLMQMIDGSGQHTTSETLINWGYLSSNRWQDFAKTELLGDTTNKLLDTGIIRLNIPTAASNTNDLLTRGLHWIRVATTTDNDAVSDVVNMMTQAVSATFAKQDNVLDHLSQPLAANSVTGLVEATPEIASVSQPYSSLNGRLPETDSAFYIRISEHLRHKNRAINQWDYERLVLSKFPQLYRVKCLTQVTDNTTNEPSQAKVTLVTIPNISNNEPFFPLQPKASLQLLEQVKRYMLTIISPFVELEVKNPVYQLITYRVEVRFKEGFDQGFFLKQLNEDLVEFLTPWAFKQQGEMLIKDTIPSSTIVHFIEQRPYIDFINNLRLIEQVTVTDPITGEDSVVSRVNGNNIAQTATPDTLLVSAPQHLLSLVEAGNNFDGIGFMAIEVDFYVS